MNNKEKRKKIKSLQNQIKRYREYINKENPLMRRSIESYKKYIPILESKLRNINEPQRISNKRF